MEREITAWKNHLRTHGDLTAEDIIELDDRLRSSITDLKAKGLSNPEAFIIAVRRTGKVSAVAAEYSKIPGQADLSGCQYPFYGGYRS